METGFLNFHDEEHFSTDLYEQSNGFDSENSLFGGIIADYNGQFDTLPLQWVNVDEFIESESNHEVKDEEEDYQKTFHDWQEHISNLQVRDVAGKRVLLDDPLSTEIPDIFGSTLDLPPEEPICLSPCIKEENMDYVEIQTIKEENMEPIVNDIFETNTLDAVKTEILESPGYKIEEENIDIETISEEAMPVLEAGDLKTLLEQFEASEAVNREQVLSEPVIEPMKIEVQPTANNLKHANKSIRDALPIEVIERIKESSKRKKGISIVPPARLPPQKSTTKPEETTLSLSQKKLLEIVSRKPNGGSVQLDHDYCTNASQGDLHPPDDAFAIQKSDYAKIEECTSPSNKDKWENSRKDSGLESGEMSDASDSTVEKTKILNKVQISLLKGNQEKVSPGQSNLVEHVLVTQVKVERSDMPMISVLKPLSDIKQELKEDHGKHEEENLVPKEEPVEVKKEQKKKKLNLEEYRKRRQNMKSHDQDSSKPPKVTLPDSTTAPGDKLKDILRVMVNAEVQTQSPDGKKPEPEEKVRPSSRERRSHRKYRSHRSNSSSSSSLDSRSRSSRKRSRNIRRYSRNRSQRSIWSRSRSRSNSSSYSNSSFSSRSRSRSRSKGSRHYSKSRSTYRREYSHRSSSYNRWSPPRGVRRQEDWNPLEKLRQVEERRVIYVGQIEEGTTKAQLRERFNSFGPIVDISLHFRERGDNYGFVTFAYKVDAYEAVEHGNDNPLEPRYDICFGGRRAFCKQRYSDLDGASTQGYGPYQSNSRSNDSFDSLLREAQENLRKRSCV